MKKVYFALRGDLRKGTTDAPELVIEILSPGEANERPDRQVQLKLYSSQGVEKSWIVSWELQQVEVYRCENVAWPRSATYRVPKAACRT